MSFQGGAPAPAPLDQTPERTGATLLRRGWLRGAKLFFSLWIVAQVGCCCFNSDPSRFQLLDGVFVRYRDCVWANRAYNLEYGHCRRPFNDHFRKGFVAGYIDVCRGGNGYVPAVPPSEYMNYEYQSAEGASCVNAWFEGFPAGAQAAKTRNLDQYANAYVSKIMQDAIKQEQRDVKLPSEIQIVSGPPSNQPFDEKYDVPMYYEGQLDETNKSYRYR